MARFEGLDILGAFQVGNQIRNSRQANDREDANLQRLYEQDAAQAAAEEQRQAIALEGRRLDLQNNKAKERAENTALMQQRAAKALALRPENHRYIQKQIDNMAAAEHIDRFQLPGGPGFSEAGPPTPQEADATGAPTQDEVGQFAAMSGVEPKSEARATTPDITEYEYGLANKGFRAAKEAEAAAARRAAEAKSAKGDAKDLLDYTSALRKEFQSLPVVKDATQMSAAYEKIKSASPNGPGTIRMLVGYMKMLDPTSVVREGEFATAADAGGLTDKMIGIFNKAEGAGGLSDTLRAEFMTEARSLVAAQRRSYEKAAARYRSIAAKGGADPAEVVFGNEATEEDSDDDFFNKNRPAQ